MVCLLFIIFVGACAAGGVATKARGEFCGWVKAWARGELGVTGGGGGAGGKIYPVLFSFIQFYSV